MEVWVVANVQDNVNVKQYVRSNFLYRRSLPEYQLLEDIKNGKLFGYV